MRPPPIVTSCLGCWLLLLAACGCTDDPATQPKRELAPAAATTPVTTPAAAPAATEGATQMADYNELTPFEQQVILKKGTERAFTGEYTDLESEGTYICRQCNAELYRSSDKFHSGCGWPSFDDEIAGAVERHEDNSLGMERTEIVCVNCKGHLGHVFLGDPTSPNGTRHCVNSVSMRFVKKGEALPAKIVKKK